MKNFFKAVVCLMGLLGLTGLVCVGSVTGSDGGKNQVEVRPGSIGIVSADCPDKLCVRQGFLSDLSAA